MIVKYASVVCLGWVGMSLLRQALTNWRAEAGTRVGRVFPGFGVKLVTASLG